MLKIKLKTLLLAVAVIAVFLAGRKSQRDFPDLLSAMRPQEIPVFVVRQDMRPREVIGKDDLVIEFWPHDKVPKGAIEKVDELLGYTPNVAVYAGEPLLKSKIGN